MARRKQSHRARARGPSPELLALLIDAVPVLIGDDVPRALKGFWAFRRQVRDSPTLADRYKLAPVPTRGRPPGARRDVAVMSMLLTLVLDGLGLTNAQTLRALELEAFPDSTNFPKIARWLRLGRDELEREFSKAPEARAAFVATQRAMSEEDRSIMIGELTQLARASKIDPVIGREQNEIKRVILLLLREIYSASPHLFDAPSADSSTGGAPPP